MFKKLLIIGCGLIGSSILRGCIDKKISKKIFVFEKSKKNIYQIKKINSKITILKKLDKKISDIDIVIISTPMSQYEKIIPNLNKFLGKKSIITDVGSTKQNILNLKNKKLNKSLDWILSHPISGSEVSGPEYGSKSLFINKWCIIIKDKNSRKQKNYLHKNNLFPLAGGCLDFTANPQPVQKRHAPTHADVEGVSVPALSQM